MQDRETALKEQENAREWQAIAYGDHPATWAALAYYRERGWPVDANTFPERDRCENRIFAFKAGYAAALASPLSAPPQVDVVALARAYRALVEHVAEQQATPDESWRAQADSLDRMLELEAALTKAALDKAKRRALTIFDTWLRVTGAMPAGSSWVCEAESCIEDAVEIGVQAAYGIHRPLESESDAAPPQEPTGASPQAETSEQAMRLRDELATRILCVPFRGADVKPSGPYLLLDDVLRVMERPDLGKALDTCQPAPVSPVEPTPPTLECCACGHLNTPQQATRLEGEWRSSGEYVCLDSDACARRIAECSEPPVEPTPEPEVPTDPLAPRKPVVNLMAALRKSLESLDRTKKVPSEETPR